MGKINVLSAAISELIAAGEVIDRPASIIKELVENALDAGATRITVELKHGGITFLKVTDNGSGMVREDVPLAFIRHATSKIANENDLDSIGTLGFRGEALPSIAAVSRVKVITRIAESPLGCCYSIDASSTPVLEDTGCPVGTSIEVRDVFYNTPARMKFLKKDATEANAVNSLMDRLALANPHVAFELILDGRRVLKTPGDGKLLSVVRIICGAELAAGMIPVSFKSGGISVSGFISRPAVSRSTRSLQMFFINSRYVRSKTCAGAVEEAYKNRLMSGRFPACVLNLEIDFSLVDVNVHPAKLEVRFSDEKGIYNAVYSACADALLQNERRSTDIRKKITTFSLSDFDYSGRQLSFTHSGHNAKPEDTMPKGDIPLAQGYFPPISNSQSDLLELHDDTKIPAASFDKREPHARDFFAFSANRAEIDIEKPAQEDKPVTINTVKPAISTVAFENWVQPASAVPPANPFLEHDGAVMVEAPSIIEEEQKPAETSYRIIGELFKTYILIEQAGRFILIDKHAAHERFIYNSIKHLEHSDDKQLLLIPQTVSLPRDEYFALVEHPEALKTLGIVAEDFGEGTFLVRELPMLLDGYPLIELLGEVAKAVMNQKNNVTPHMLDELLYSVSCRAAVMAGKHSTIPEMKTIADMVLGEQQIRHCPHGRPVLVEFSQREVEKLFGRMG